MTVAAPYLARAPIYLNPALHLQMELRNIQCSTSSPNRWLKLRPNRSIIGDTILLQTETKLSKTYGSVCGSLLLTPQRKTAIMVLSCSQSRGQRAQKMFWKTFCPLSHVVRTLLFVPSYFWITHANFDNSCQRYRATYGN